MKMSLRFVGLPPVEIEADADECADFMLKLGQKTGLDRQIPPERPHPPKSESAPLSPEPTPKPSILPRSKPSRRDMIYQAMQHLHQEGCHEADLQTITAKFQELNPDEETKNLDQVVRDMANKTDLLDRADRGTFKLAKDPLP